jgi:hypothetical protein
MGKGERGKEEEVIYVILPPAWPNFESYPDQELTEYQGL